MPTVLAIVAVLLAASFTGPAGSPPPGSPQGPSVPAPSGPPASGVAPAGGTSDAAVTQAGAETATRRPVPKVRTRALKGIDAKVLAGAPAPHHSGVSAMGVGEPPRLRPAAAATLKLTDPAALVAVTADAPFPDGTEIQVRVKQADGWSDWNELSAGEGHGPDPGSAEAKMANVGTDPLMTVGATQAQVRIDTPQGRLPKGTKLTSVTSPTGAGDARAGGAAATTAGTVRQASLTSTAATTTSTTVPAAAPTVAMPPIITRAQWGADESWRNRAPWYTNNIRVGFVHHTASSSKYSQAEAAAQVRAIYAYHTKSLGHSDIDYNFVVDRFGRLYEGRAGGMDRAVLGGHTAGFNEHSFALVALGNFQSFKPSSAEMAAIKDSMARLFAWKLSLSGVNPGATEKLISAGYIKATRYNKGAVATLPALSSHQMVNYTACPGTNLQAELPDIRRLAAGYSKVVISAPSPPVASFQIGQRSSVAVNAHTNRTVTWRADVLSPCSDVPVRSFAGRAAAGSIPFTWDLRDSHGKAVLPTNYTIRMTGTADDGTPVPATSATLSITPAPGGAWGPCGNASRVIGASPAESSVLWGRIIAPTSKTVVVSGYSDAGPAALAASLSAVPLARKLRAPLLVTPGGSLPPTVSSEIRRRAAQQIIVVGGTDVISAAVATSLGKLGAKVTRLSGADAAGTARAVAARMGYKGTPLAVDTVGSPIQAVAAAALAAAHAIPLAIAPASQVAGSAVALADPVAAARALADAHPGQPASVMVLPSNQVLATSAVAASAGAPVLVSNPASPSPATLSYLATRPGLSSANTPASTGALADVVLGAASRMLTGEPWAPAGMRLDSGLTTARKVSRANASPEPVRAKRQLTISAKVKGKYADGKWRAIPAGVPFDVQFKAKGKKKYTIAASGLTQEGRARLALPASKSGRWRIVVTGKASASDYVAVRK